jgi:acetyltransferase-like isoleucine patch superfamily enzyme
LALTMRGALLGVFVRLIDLLKVRKLVAAVARRENDLACRRATSSAAEAMFGPTAVVHNRRADPRAIQIGEKSLIDGELMVFDDAGSIRIGASSFLGKGSRVWSGEKVEIGARVFISHNVTISDTDAHPTSAKARAEDYEARIVGGKPYAKGSVETAPIVIEDDAWINFGVAILKGVRIGRGAIVGAGSVVTKDVPAWTFAAGVPAKPVRAIEER